MSMNARSANSAPEVLTVIVSSKLNAVGEAPDRELEFRLERLPPDSLGVLFHRNPELESVACSPFLQLGVLLRLKKLLELDAGQTQDVLDGLQSRPGQILSKRE